MVESAVCTLVHKTIVIEGTRERIKGKRETFGAFQLHKLLCTILQVCILYGDGSCGYSIAEFDTFVRHKFPVYAIIGNNATWAQIERDQVDNHTTWKTITWGKFRKRDNLGGRDLY